MYVFYDTRLIKKFISRVLPILEARGYSIDKENVKNYLEHEWFKSFVSVWSIDVLAPLEGSVYSCQPRLNNKGYFQSKLFDMNLIVDWKSGDDEKESLIKIERNWGLTAFGTKATTKSDSFTNKQGRHSVFLLSNNGVTILVEPINALGCLIAVDR